MSVKLGNIPIEEMHLGDVSIGKAYLGDVLVYRKGEVAPYLEIEPEIIWVVPDWAVDNEVFSNTTWNIN